MRPQFDFVCTGNNGAGGAPFHQHAVYSLRIEAEGKQLDTLQSLERRLAALIGAQSSRRFSALPRWQVALVYADGRFFESFIGPTGGCRWRGWPLLVWRLRRFTHRVR